MLATASGRRRLVCRFLWYRIQPTWMPRMALAQAFRRQKTALGRAVYLDGFNGVGGTGRVETAILAKERTDAQLVRAQ